MRVLIVYCHPSQKSFTYQVRKNFIRGLEKAEHSWEISDLYQMNFKTDMSEEEYIREGFYRRDLPVPPDVKKEQEKINWSNAIVFIYPVFWSEAPAKLVGWFNRVWTYGFAYGENREMNKLARALVICIAGRTKEDLKKHGHLQSMKNVMLGDRLFERATEKEMIVLDGTARNDSKLRKKNWKKNLDRIYNLGLNL